MHGFPNSLFFYNIFRSMNQKSVKSLSFFLIKSIASWARSREEREKTSSSIFFISTFIMNLLAERINLTPWNINRYFQSLIIDADAVLTHPVLFKRLQLVSRRLHQNFSFARLRKAWGRFTTDQQNRDLSPWRLQRERTSNLA